MRKLKTLILIIPFLIAGCNKHIAPAETELGKIKNFNSSEFDYYYVEGIKQKLLGNYGESLKYFEQCIRLNPGSDATWYQMGQVLASNGNLHEAKKYVLKAISLDEKNLWYLVSLSGMYYQEKNLDSAIVYYERASRYYPSNENLQLTLGNLYIETGKYDRANSIFDSFDKKYGVNETSTLLSVRSLAAAGKFEEAKAKIESLLAVKPDEVLYNGLLAEILSSQGEKDEALSVYKKMIDGNPGDGQVQIAAAEFLINEKKYNEIFDILNTVILNSSIRKEEKISLFARLLEVPEVVNKDANSLLVSLMVLEKSYPEDEVVPILRADLLVKRGELQEAVNRLEELIAANEGNYYAWEKLLLVYLEQKNYDRLFERGRECAKRFNMSLIAKLLYANAAIETGKYDIALEELKKAEIIAGANDESLVQVLTMRADLYYRMKDYNKAFATFDEAMKKDSKDMTLLNNYAYYLAEQNLRLKEAEEMALKVVNTEKDNTTFLDTYAWVLYKRGKLREASRIMETIIAKDARGDAEWFEHYGYILKKQKKYEKAGEAWKKAMELDGTKTYLIGEIENCKR